MRASAGPPSADLKSKPMPCKTQTFVFTLCAAVTIKKGTEQVETHAGAITAHTLHIDAVTLLLSPWGAKNHAASMQHQY